VPARLERTAQGRERVGRNFGGPGLVGLTRRDTAATLVSSVQVSGIRWLLVLGCVSAFALVLVGAAPSATSKPAGKFEVLPVAKAAGGGLALDVYSSMGARAPARVTIYVPAGFAVDTSAAPGTLIGDSYLAYSTSSSGVDVAFGTVGARDPASGGPAAQACAPGTHAAMWMATFDIEQESLEIPFYVDPTQGSEASLGAFKLVACLASPYVPVAEGGAPDNLRVTELVLGLSEPGRSVITKPASGKFTWRLFTTPYVDGTATPNDGATFEARARMLLPHVMTERVRYLRKTKTVLITGRVRLLGKPEGGMIVTVAGGAPTAEFLDYFGQTKTRADGTYSLRKRVTQRRRARRLRVYVFGVEVRSAPCVEPSVAPAGCVHQSFSAPQSASADVTIPRLLRNK
jgi:hypothetical protein